MNHKKGFVASSANKEILFSSGTWFTPLCMGGVLEESIEKFELASTSETKTLISVFVTSTNPAPHEDFGSLS